MPISVQGEDTGPIDRAVPALLKVALERTGEARLKVAGTSMLPAIRPADILIVTRVPIASITPGDVVLFVRAERLYAHRVVGVEGSPKQPVLVTRGDRHPRREPPVDESMLLGRVSGLIRNGARIRVRRNRPVSGSVVAMLIRSRDAVRHVAARVVKNDHLKPLGLR